MECPFCHAPITKEAEFCPHCGKALKTEYAFTVEAVTGEEELVTAPVEETQEAPKKKYPVEPLIWGTVALVLLVLTLLFVFRFARPATPSDPDAIITGGGNYTVSHEEFTEEIASKEVVFSHKGKDQNAIDNATLALYYWDTVYAFYENYGYYLQYIGFDPTKLESTQCAISQEQTWQEYFLTEAINRYRSQNAVYTHAMNEGYTLPESAQTQYDGNLADMKSNENLPALLLQTYGAGITPEDYFAYWTVQYYYSIYMSEKMETFQFTEEDLSSFYDAHAEEYASIRIPKVSKPVMHVRHILITPAEPKAETDWSNAQSTAQHVLDTYLSGEQTETAFAALAKLHSEDGNAADGGLYENVYPGQMVEEFEAWCFDDNRKVGDTGIVQTEHGYHVMYYVGQGDYIHWQEMVKMDLTSEEANNWVAKIRGEFTLEYDLANIAITLPGQILNPPVTE